LAFGTRGQTGRFLVTNSETGLYYYRARYYDPNPGRFIGEDPDGFVDGLNVYSYVKNSPMLWGDPLGLAHCEYSISGERLTCVPDDPSHSPVSIRVASGNNGNGSDCKNNPNCTKIHDTGPIPQGWWKWDNNGWSGKPEGRVLVPLPGTDLFGRQSNLFRSHSCGPHGNPFGPAKYPPFCSKGCITGTPSDMKKLNQLLDAEPGSTLHVID